MKRKMLFFERLMYVDGRTPVNCVITARIHGDIAAESLRLALEKVQRKHPLLRAGVLEENGRPYFVFRANPPEIPVRMIERRSNDDWRDTTVLEWKTPFDMSSGPMIRVVWIKSEGISELMLVGHHCVCDGASLVAIFREILQVIDRPDVQLIPYAPIQSLHELVPQEVSSNIKMALLVKSKALLFRLFALTVKTVKTKPARRTLPHLLESGRERVRGAGSPLQSGRRHAVRCILCGFLTGVSPGEPFEVQEQDDVSCRHSQVHRIYRARHDVQLCSDYSTITEPRSARRVLGFN